jgi:hypothetical protein
MATVSGSVADESAVARSSSFSLSADDGTMPPTDV